MTPTMITNIENFKLSENLNNKIILNVAKKKEFNLFSAAFILNLNSECLETKIYF